MRKGCPGGLFGPPGPCFTCSSVQLKNAHAGSVWPVSHHQPASDAAYNREAYVGQQGGFVKGRTSARQRGGGGGGRAAPAGGTGFADRRTVRAPRRRAGTRRAGDDSGGSSAAAHRAGRTSPRAGRAVPGRPAVPPPRPAPALGARRRSGVSCAASPAASTGSLFQVTWPPAPIPSTIGMGGGGASCPAGSRRAAPPRLPASFSLRVNMPARWSAKRIVSAQAKLRSAGASTLKTGNVSSVIFWCAADAAIARSSSATLRSVICAGVTAWPSQLAAQPPGPGRGDGDGGGRLDPGLRARPAFAGTLRSRSRDHPVRRPS